MAQKMVEVSVWVCVDSDGDYAVGKDDALAIEAYESDILELTSAGGFRMVEITVKVPLPTTIELIGEVPVDSNTATITVK